MRFFKDYLKYRKKSVYMYLLFVAIFLLTFSLPPPAPAVYTRGAVRPDCHRLPQRTQAEKKRRETLSSTKEAGIELCKAPRGHKRVGGELQGMVFAFAGIHARRRKSRGV